MDHGTALDLAGTGEANLSSFLGSISGEHDDGTIPCDHVSALDSIFCTTRRSCGIASAMALQPGQKVLRSVRDRALTEYLFDQPDRYLAVEIDRDLALPFPKFPGIEVLEQDILRTDFAAVLSVPNRAGSGWCG